MSRYTLMALHDEAKIAPGQYLWDKQPTPQEMRQQLIRASRSSHVLCNVRIYAEREGWSGEDTYTAMAWFAMLEAERYAEDNAQRMMLSVTQGLAPLA